MLILALESTAQIASAALWQDGEMLALSSLSSGNTHSTTLLPMVEQMLKNTGRRISDVDLFACTVGPGSFTGVRIGAATLQGLAFGTDKPCVGVSSLTAMAYHLRGFPGILCPVIGARRCQLYTALFRSDGEHICRLTEDEIVLTPDLTAYLAPYDEPVHFTGDGYTDAIRSAVHPHLCTTPAALRVPSAFAVAEAAYDLYESTEDKSAFTLADLQPVYLRKTQAERELEEKRNL
ncbi:MAG: tRNA (adenosine(37)-N6)-threonylcarbamoyltransferase complex dimerization subunit type 1 TsaB [Clostridia bacterium]|nr:tRNA (adenosine(37)-N6)-threonylcarbamoyltransferase complex dimerization subunit type 1 TsaB [Clostridia bacterium]